jgi:hypothetical protein
VYVEDGFINCCYLFIIVKLSFLSSYPPAEKSFSGFYTGEIVFWQRGRAFGLRWSQRSLSTRVLGSGNINSSQTSPPTPM